MLNRLLFKLGMNRFCNKSNFTKMKKLFLHTTTRKNISRHIFFEFPAIIFHFPATILVRFGLSASGKSTFLDPHAPMIKISLVTLHILNQRVKAVLMVGSTSPEEHEY